MRVRSVAGLEMAAGLPGSSGPEGVVRKFARPCEQPCEVDHLQRARRFIRECFELRVRSAVTANGIPVSKLKHAEIVFEGADSPCYLALGMGAEGMVTNTFRRPN